MDNHPWSQQAYRLLSIILLKQPMRTWCGGLLGLAFIALNGIASFIFRIPGGRLYEQEWHLLIIGVVLLHAQTLWNVFVGKPQFDEDVEAALNLIQRSKLDGMSQARVNMAYQTLCERVIRRVGSVEGIKAPQRKGPAITDE